LIHYILYETRDFLFHSFVRFCDFWGTVIISVYQKISMIFSLLFDDVSIFAEVVVANFFPISHALLNVEDCFFFFLVASHKARSDGSFCFPLSQVMCLYNILIGY